MSTSSESESAPERPTAPSVATRAVRELAELTGHDIESVIGVERHEDGWRVRLEVVELRRVPDSTDLLSAYEVDLDDGAEVTSFRRLRRYDRGRARED
ncbi:gas vesicle protein GvpO [Haloactinopolyspora alba]|uniref:Gas vesicle protein GvpO n=1 Tax=Haloactinopolyspora alba TaxID=648780 RepID=A0A2P8D3V4_9ACTN|nr:gas vesicle protein GvpO [Haloactinopolyspora alba]PSK91895.1 gas vesicle protein GvpO [Haloactinopolyspora alba]